MLLVVALVCASVTATAIEMDAEVGFGGVYVPGRWTPVTLLLDNLPRADKANQKLESFDGKVVVHSRAATTQQRQIGFEREVVVPVNDRKRVTVYAKFPDRLDQLTADLITKNGKRVGRVDLVARNAVEEPNNLVVFVRSEEMHFDLPKFPDMPQAQNGLLAADNLPDRWYGYDGVAMVVIPRITEKLLPPERAEALRQWVSQGGRLLLIGGRNGPTFRGSPLDDMLPAEYLDSDPFDIADGTLRPADSATSASPGTVVQIDRMKLRPEGRVLAGSGGVGILYGRQFDSGEVWYLASDWSPRLMGLVPADKLIASALATAPDFAGARSRFDMALVNNQGEVLGLGSALTLPRKVLILAVLLSYLAIVGPLNFFLLARRKRLEWAWVTVPLIVAAYTLGIYLFSATIKGRDTVLRNYYLVTGRANSEVARCDGLSMLFVQTQGGYTLGPKKSPQVAQCDHASWRGLGYGFGPGGVPGSSEQTDVRVAQAPDGMTMPNKPVAQWSTDFTRFESVAALGGSIECDLQLDGNLVTGVVRNRTRQRLGSVTLSYGASMYSIPTPGPNDPHGGTPPLVAIEPGAEAEVSIEIGKTPANAFGITPPAGGGDPFRQRVFAALISTLGRGGAAAMLDVPPVLLCGEIEVAPYEVAVDAPISQQSAHAIFALQAPVRRVSASVSPADLPPGRWIATGGGMNAGGRGQRHYGPQGGLGLLGNPWLSLNRSSAVFSSMMPFVGPATAVAGVMPVGQRANNPGDSIEVQIFDFATFDWKPAATEIVNAAPPQRPDPSPGGTLVQQGFPNFAYSEQANQTLNFRADGLANAIHPFTHATAVRVIHVPDQKAAYGQPCMVMLPGLNSLTLAPTEENKS